MHKAIKAALISALIFPGCGHFYLKSKLRGAVFSLFSLGCLYVLMSYAMGIANDISDRLISGDIPMDIANLIAEISLQLDGVGGEPVHRAGILLLGCWGIAIVDSLVLGRKLDLPVTTN